MTKCENCLHPEALHDKDGKCLVLRDSYSRKLCVCIGLKVGAPTGRST